MIQEFMGKWPQLSTYCFVHEQATLIGDVVIGERASVWPGAVLRGDIDRISLGVLSNVQDNCVLHCDYGKPIVIGDNVTIGHGAILHSCVIEDDALIGMGAIVLDGAFIGRGAVVGAGAVVPPRARVEAGQLVLGSPAKHIRDVRPEEAEANRAAPAHYWQLAQTYIISAQHDM